MIVLENDKVILKIFSQGATLNSFYIKSLDLDIVLGLKKDTDYLEKNSASMGKSIGRCANRIGGGKFSLDGKEYILLANNGHNTLHGGEVNFGNVKWDVKEHDSKRAVFTYRSKDMESGFPGNLDVEAIYELNDYELTITYTGVSDKDTVFNMTNHTYFNLNRDKSDILNHDLKINADRINLNDENGMAKEISINVANTPFDFRNFKKIGDAVSANGILLNQYCKGIEDGIVKTDGSEKRIVDNLDTNYIFENTYEKVMCEVRNKNLKVKISSDLPDVQVYTGKSINVDGKDAHYGAYAGIAIEPQFCPNAINYDKFLKPIIKANEKVSHFIKYQVEV